MSSDIRAQLAGRLKSARKSAGLSQAQVAQIMKMHRPTISEIEAGRRRVTADELLKFADIYGVSMDWLSSGDSGSDSYDDIMIAARELSKMDDESLEKLLGAIQMVKKTRDKN